jgi:diadenosine tetraphosphate (Ap4A) HIT family hydrolase
MIDVAKFREGSFKADRIGYALRGENPTTITRLQSGFVFLMDVQFLPGWCVLTAYPQVSELTDLPFEGRNAFLADMQVLGEAIAAVTNPVRMNYSILGNTDNYLHAHVYPRYAWEEPERLRGPAWLYPEELTWRNPACWIDERHVELAERIADKLRELGERYRVTR